MKNNMTQISRDTQTAILVALRLSIQDIWKYRHAPCSTRQQLKTEIQALREMRQAQNIFIEKYFWVK
jgi:hypothetical protein